MKDPARVAGGVDNRLNEDPSLFPYLSPMYVSFGIRGKLHSYDKSKLFAGYCEKLKETNNPRKDGGRHGMV